MSTDNLKQAEKDAAKAKKKAEKAARKAEKMKEKARRKALKDGTLKAALDETPTDPDAPDPLRPRTEEELKVELEDLRAMVQGEIDEMREQAPDAEWDDIVKQALYEKQHGIKAEYHRPVMCEICGEHEVAEGTDYCEECLDDMKHYPFEWWQFIIPLMAVFFLVFGILLAHEGFPIYHGTAQAQSLAREGKLMSALDKYGELNGQIAEGSDTYGFQYRKNQVKLLNRTGIQQYGVLANYLEAYYPNDLNKWYNRYAQQSKARIDEYEAAYNCFEEAAKSSKDFKSLIKAYDKAIEGKDINPAFANYYRYYACLIYEQGLDTQKKYVEAIKAISPERGPEGRRQSLRRGPQDRRYRLHPQLPARHPLPARGRLQAGLRLCGRGPRERRHREQLRVRLQHLLADPSGADRRQDDRWQERQGRDQDQAEERTVRPQVHSGVPRGRDGRVRLRRQPGRRQSHRGQKDPR